MFSNLPLVFITLFATSSASALIIPRHRAIDIPARAVQFYATGSLENYDIYKTRFTALGCSTQHNTTFFEKCCHPLLATESPDSLPIECKLKAPSSKATPSKFNRSPKTSSTPSPAKNSGANPPKNPQSSSSHTSSSPKSSPSSNKGSGSSSGTNNGGFATYFTQNGVAGACGKVHKDSDLIAAIDQARYGSSGKTSPLCGHQVRITNVKNGKTVTVTIEDDCPTCKNSNSIDLSVAAFNQIATEAEGMVPISWQLV